MSRIIEKVLSKTTSAIKQFNEYSENIKQSVAEQRLKAILYPISERSYIGVKTVSAQIVRAIFNPVNMMNNSVTKSDQQAIVMQLKRSPEIRDNLWKKGVNPDQVFDTIKKDVPDLFR